MARMTRTWRAMMLAGVLALAGCQPGTDMATSSPSSASTAAVTSLQSETTSQATFATVVASGLESLMVVSGPANDDGLLGAGCMVDADEPLPDGDWFGFVLESTNHALVVDIACVYGPNSDQFQAYAAESGSPWSSYVVVNDVVEARKLLYGPNTQAYMAKDDWQPRLVREVVEQSREDPHQGPRGVWIRVEDGRIGAVVQPHTMGVATD